MELDEIIMVRANFDYYPKNFLDYTDVDATPGEGVPVGMKTVNDINWAHKIGPVAGVLLHSGEKAAKIALSRLKKIK